MHQQPLTLLFQSRLQDYVSGHESPVGKALIRHRAGDVVRWPLQSCLLSHNSIIPFSLRISSNVGKQLVGIET